MTPLIQPTNNRLHYRCNEDEESHESYHHPWILQDLIQRPLIVAHTYTPNYERTYTLTHTHTCLLTDV